MKDERLIAMRVFEAVVEAGGFTAAARTLGVSQPFVSQTIQRLEKRLKTRLLHRTTRGHYLTPEGEAYLEGCRVAIASVESADALLQAGDDQIRGHLRISAPLAFGLDRVTPLVPTFLNRYPGISLDLMLTDDSVNLVEERVDVAIRMGHLADSSLLSRRLCQLTRVVVAAPRLIDRYGMPKVPQDLMRFPSLSWDGARDHLNRWSFVVDGQIHTYYADGRFRGNAGMALFQMCKDGFGIMRCAEHLARPAIHTGELVPLLENLQSPDDSAFHAVFLPDRNLLPRIRVFIDFMVDAFRIPDW